MMKKNAIIGGEESGGYGFRGHVPERDAILAGLYFLDFMATTKKTPSQLLDYLYSKVGPHYYDRRDFHISATRRQTILHRLGSSPPATVAGSKVTRIDATDGFRFFLGDESWLLIRFSGTEPLVRIYAEAESLERASQLLDEGKELHRLLNTRGVNSIFSLLGFPLGLTQIVKKIELTPFAGLRWAKLGSKITMDFALVRQHVSVGCLRLTYAANEL